MAKSKWLMYLSLQLLFYVEIYVIYLFWNTEYIDWYNPAIQLILKPYFSWITEITELNVAFIQPLTISLSNPLVISTQILFI